MTDPNITTANSTHNEWLIEHDPHVDASWINRCIFHGEYIIALCGDSPVGFLRYSWFWGKIPYMDMVYVAPEQRGSGIGRKMLRHWEMLMLAKGADVLMTSSVADELEPQAWHRSNGFHEQGRISFGSFQPQSEVFFIKDLSC